MRTCSYLAHTQFLLVCVALVLSAFLPVPVVARQPMPGPSLSASAVPGLDGAASVQHSRFRPTPILTSKSTSALVSSVNLLANISAISAGGHHTCALTTGGGVKCWGWNEYGQLGDGTTTSRLTPVDVSGLSSGVQAIAVSDYHTCALTTAKGVKCWGYNGFGQLGDGTTTNRLIPVDVSGLSSGVQAIAGGGGHTCVLTTSGGVKCWGLNKHGQLGDGATIDRLTPVDVSGLSSGVQAIAGGWEHTCVLTTPGSAKCWGWNDYGQLGDGTTISRNKPVNVSGVNSGVQAIAAGSWHTCALTVVGGVKCWGINNWGQLGDGTTTSRNTAVDVSNLASGIQVIIADGGHTCALTTAGNVKCWGYNNAGQLGDGTTTNRLTPVNVSSLGSSMQTITAGGAHTCGLTTTAAVRCWGYNYYGQLGDGTMTDRWTPIDVIDPAADYAIGGRISDKFGNGIANVLVQVGNGQSAVTNAQGYYNIAGLPQGVYTVKPILNGWGFTTGVFDQVVYVVIDGSSPPPKTYFVDFVGVQTPLIFIPGVMGSELRLRGASGDLWPGKPRITDRTPMSLRPDLASDIVATAAIRSVLTKPQYRPILDFLTDTGSDKMGERAYVEYVIDKNPGRLTAEGCDATQMADLPTLFVFPYDWRQSNQQSAIDLWGYIACIRRFYPGTSVNIVAHSQGGLVARRYILDNLASHGVNQVITVGTPWLGAPKALHVLETGQYDVINIFIAASQLRELAEYYPGAYELLPTRAYFAMGNRPFRENGWDFDSDGSGESGLEVYEYDHYVQVLDARYPRSWLAPDNYFNPGSLNQEFHDRAGQDSWATIEDGVEYHYLVGRQPTDQTIAAMTAMKTDQLCPGVTVCDLTTLLRLDLEWTQGDGTVPLYSARRARLGDNPDGANIQIHEVVADPSASLEDNIDLTEHGGMTRNPAVHRCIRDLLAGGSCMLDSAAVGSAALEMSEPAYYLSVVGASTAIVTNSGGFATGLLSDTTYVEDVPEVDFYTTSDLSFLAVMPAAGVYSATFKSGDLPLRINVEKGTADATSAAVRYIDLVLPAGANALLVLSPAGVEWLRYDSDGNGTFDSLVQPNVDVNGALASDATPPSIQISASADGKIIVTAADESGVSSIRYSLDGERFSIYQQPVTPPGPGQYTVHAFADDRAGNRSLRAVAEVDITVVMPPDGDGALYLPLIAQ